MPLLLAAVTPLSSLFHCKLLAPDLIGGRPLYMLGTPLGKATLPNLAGANIDPRTPRGHVITGAAS